MSAYKAYTMRKPIIAGLLLTAFISISLAAQEPYIRTPRDTGPRPAPFEMPVESMELDEAYQFMAESDTVELYFRDDRDVFAIRDKRNGFLWKTGLDIPFNREVDDLAEEILDAGGDPSGLALEDRLNTTYTGLANSLVSIEYYDNANNIKRIGSAAYDDARSSLRVNSTEPFLATLSVAFDDPEISFQVNIALEGDELVISVPDESLEGEDLFRLAFLNIAPFFAANGGRQVLWDPAEEDFEIEAAKDNPDGYAVVPDGSGALVRFVDNSVRLSDYVGDVYGWDLGQAGRLITWEDFSPPPKNAYLPLYGMVLGDEQNAFAGYASSGAEYLEIVAVPEEQITYYTQAYPRFVYNRLYFQVYNRNGDGYFRTLENRNSFDAEFRYRFLTGTEADYPGIARAYRRHLEDNGLLPSRAPSAGSGDIPLRIDFIMADQRKSIIGQAHEVTTTIQDVDAIVDDLQSSGIENLSLGLIGYSRGGSVLFRPGRVNLLGELGRRRDFEAVIGELREEGVDISFSREYGLIGEGQILPWGNALRSASGYYVERRTFETNAPVNLFYFARPRRIVEWVESEVRQMERFPVTSVSLGGFPEMLHSDYATGNFLSASDIMELYTGMFQGMESDLDLGINLYQPNQYLWPYTDRFLHAPVFSSQYLIETDTVPLLTMVLQGSMDLFARYSNFSFYSTQDILRMIDYNVYPSFLITEESATLLLSTNSSDNYSSQYEIYRDLILEVYGKVNAVLREVKDARWIDRQVLADGVIVNEYDNGARVVVNYTANPFEYQGITVPAEEARVFASGRN
jgi:hypothetical protein